MYYLQSRYYDPEVGRFVNADAYASTGQGILCCNMFAYCSNNPIRYIDSNGHDAEVATVWIDTMWWLTLVDGPLPYGDFIFLIGFVVCVFILVSSDAKDNDASPGEVTSKDPPTEADGYYAPPNGPSKGKTKSGKKADGKTAMVTYGYRHHQVVKQRMAVGTGTSKEQTEKGILMCIPVEEKDREKESRLFSSLLFGYIRKIKVSIMRIDDICLSTNSAALTALLQGKYSMARSLFCRNLVITPNVLTLNNYAAFLLENLCGSQYLHPLRELAALAMLHLAYSFRKDTLPGLNLATVYQERIEYGLSHSYSKVASVYKRLLKDCQDSSIVYNLAVAEYRCGYFTDAAHHFLESLRYNRDRIYEEGGNPVLALYEMKYCGFSDIMPGDDDLYFASAVCDEEERYRLAFFSGQYEKVIHQAPNLFAVWEPSLQHLAMLCESYLKIFDGEIILSGDSLSFLAEDALRILSDFKENNASRRAALIQNECSLPFLSFCQYYGCTEHIESYNRCEVLLTNH